jgi:hypothetical protein
MTTSSMQAHFLLTDAENLHSTLEAISLRSLQNCWHQVPSLNVSLGRDCLYSRDDASCGLVRRQLHQGAGHVFHRTAMQIGTPSQAECSTHGHKRDIRSEAAPCGPHSFYRYAGACAGGDAGPPFRNHTTSAYSKRALTMKPPVPITRSRTVSCYPRSASPASIHRLLCDSAVNRP